MKKPKFLQSEKTKYENNEFQNMPSIDTAPRDSERIEDKNSHLVNWDLVGKIVKKYGFEYAIIHDTFAFHDWHVIIYYKTDLPHDLMDYSDLYTEKYQKICQNLHECVHELDEQTELFFFTGWMGNVGQFGSYDVQRQSYICGNSFSTWRYITDRWHPNIHDTRRVLKKGTYIMTDTSSMKVLGD